MKKPTLAQIRAAVSRQLEYASKKSAALLMLADLRAADTLDGAGMFGAMVIDLMNGTPEEEAFAALHVHDDPTPARKHVSEEIEDDAPDASHPPHDA